MTFSVFESPDGPVVATGFTGVICSCRVHWGDLADCREVCPRS